MRLFRPGGRNDQESQEPKNLRTLVRALTPVIVGLLVLGAYHDHQRGYVRAEQRFREKQDFLTEHMVFHLDVIFQMMNKQLELLAIDPDVQQLAPRGRKIMSLVQRQLAMQGATLVALVDRGARPIAATGPLGPGHLRILPLLPACAPEGKMCVSGPYFLSEKEADPVLVAKMPVAETGESGGSPAEQGMLRRVEGGAVMLVLDWVRLQRLIRQITRISRSTFAWVLDGSGRLIMNHHHPHEANVANIRSRHVCGKCHDLVSVHREMLAGRAGSGTIQVGALQRKLVTYSPINVGDARWSIAVATDFRMAFNDENTDWRSTILYTGVIILVMLAGAMLLDREATGRIRAINAFRNELEQKVVERTKEIKDLYDRVVTLQSDHARLERISIVGEMAAIVAHEIRTPLNSLSINAQMISRLLRRDSDEDRAKMQKMLKTLEGEIERVSRLVEENLLKVARTEKPALEPLDASAVISDTVQFLETEATRNRVTLRFDPGPGIPRVLADEFKLRQVLLNLVLNAIQALKEGGHVQLTARQEAGRVHLAVVDDGPGIQPDEHGDVNHVFQPFRTTKPGGTGLGLAICARLVKEMQGELSVSSTPGQGATFVVSLQVPDPPA